MPRQVPLGAQFRHRAQRIREALGRPLVVGRKRDPHVAVVENRVVGAVGLLDLVQRLRDQETPDAVASEERQRAFEEFESPESRELVQHEQKLPVWFGWDAHRQFFGQPPCDLVEDQPHQRSRA